MQGKDHISVCIGTYKRPDTLRKLLNRLKEQETGNLFTYSVVLVDNDPLESAKDIVNKAGGGMKIDYFVEPKQNIALVRNRAVENATGNLIAFIDDDEMPFRDWLLNLYKTYKKYNPSGVFGPILPIFEGNSAPGWLEVAIKEVKCPRVKYVKTGDILRWEDTQTSNALLAKDVFRNMDEKFRKSFGKTGGEDSDFFKRAVEKGNVFVWSNEAPVYEEIPSKRWTVKWILMRALRTGSVYSKLKLAGLPLVWKIMFILKFISGFFVFFLLLPPSIIFGSRIFVKCLVRLVSNLGKIAGLFSFSVIEYNTE